MLHEFAPDAIITVNRHGKVILFNRAAEVLFGYGREEIIGNDIEILIPRALQSIHRSHRLGYVHHPYSRTMGSGIDIRGVRKDGSEVPVDIALGYIEIDGNVEVTAIIRDVSERQKMEKVLREAERRYQALYESNPTMYLTLGADRTILSINPFGAMELGYEMSELVGRRSDSIVSAQADIAILDEIFESCLKQPGVVYSGEVRLVPKGGGAMWVRLTARGCDDDLGNPIVYVVCQDITSERELSKRIEFQAAHDSLTGLVNRREFERRLSHVLNIARSDRTEHALCYLDLDQFKVINDTCGHLAGDELLRQIANLLTSSTRRRDTIGRLGGDEFAVLLEYCNVETATRIADNLRKAISKYRFTWQDKVFSVGASIGLVAITGQKQTVSDILSVVDSACYVAKEEGRNRIHVSHPDDAEIARWHGEMRWVSTINDALDHDRFELHFQRIISVRGSRQSGIHFELLLRMQDENGQSVPPSHFLPAAERFGLSVRLDRWVVNATIQWLSRFGHQLSDLELVCINLSGRTLGDEEFLRFVEDLLTRKKVAANRICFEITETAAIANLARAMRFINKLKEHGCQFALDDFGTGLSSFAYLRNLQVDYIKIAGPFVRDIATNPVDLAMVRSINDIAQVMGKKTIAEFVESLDVLEKLHDLGVNYAQGYHIGRPQPLRGTTGLTPDDL